MALTDPRSTSTIEPWAAPAWPAKPPDPNGVRIACGAFADELVVRFGEAAGRPAIAVAIETPDRDYVFALADDETGAVVGVQVDDLLAAAGRLYPGWTRLAQPAHRAEVVAAFLGDVAAMLARYGAGETPPAGRGAGDRAPR